MKKFIYLGGIVAVLLAVGALAVVGNQGQAAGITFIGRGVVKSGGAADHINVYWTHVPDAAERIRGLKSDVILSSAKIYNWEEKSDGTLYKRQTSGLPTPGKEVVVRGTLLDDDRVTAAWVVKNYREFKVEGTVQGVDLDTGSTDEGWITVNVSSSVMRNITPTRKFKETVIKSKDIRFRVNGMTTVMALGNVKHLDEVTASQQNVRIEGELQDEDTWTASKVNEY
jgi:hypothetical protein